MKINNRELLLFYIIAACFLAIYTLTSINECEAYWMHDAAIKINKQRFLTDTLNLFVLPSLIIFAQRFFKIKTRQKLFLTHFFTAFTSVLLLLVAINKPYENINGGHYMFVSATMTFGYFLLKSSCFIILFIILLQTILFKIRSTKLTGD